MKNQKILYFLGSLFGLAACAFIYQVIKGMGITGLNDPVPWGLYVANSSFCMGIGAGILIVLTIILKREEISEGYKLFLSMAAFISLSLSGVFILVDLGRIDRFYYMMLYAQPKSPLFWDFVALNVLIAISAIFCLITLRRIFLRQGLRGGASFVEQLLYRIVTVKREIKINDLYIKISNWFALCLIIGMYLLTTEVFIGLKAHPQWNTPLISLIFLISAVLCGFSVAMLLASLYAETSLSKNSKSFFNSRRRTVLFLLLGNLLIILLKYGIDMNNLPTQEMRTLFPFSLPIFLIIGNVLPAFLLLGDKGKDFIIYRIVPTLILTGVLLKRIEIIVSAYFTRWLPFSPDASYIPSLAETIIVVGFYSAAIAVIMLISYFIRSKLIRVE